MTSHFEADHLDGHDQLSGLWEDGLLVWKDASTWHERLSTWLAPWLVPEGKAALERLGEKDICHDDFAWREDILAPRLNEDLDLVRDQLAEDLKGATLRVYHGCRVADAGVYERGGLLRNAPASMEAEVRRIVAEEEAFAYMRGDIDRRLAEFDARERDTGKAYVCVDDREQLDASGHYALYGAEWLQAFFGSSAHEALRKRGVPTVLEIDLPLIAADDYDRKHLSDQLLNEWARRVVNRPNWTPSIDFTIILRRDLPREWIVGHYHPTALRSPCEQFRIFKTEVTNCPSCRSETGSAEALA